MIKRGFLGLRVAEYDIKQCKFASFASLNLNTVLCSKMGMKWMLIIYTLLKGQCVTTQMSGLIIKRSVAIENKLTISNAKALSIMENSFPRCNVTIAVFIYAQLEQI